MTSSFSINKRCAYQSHTLLLFAHNLLEPYKCVCPLRIIVKETIKSGNSADPWKGKKMKCRRKSLFQFAESDSEIYSFDFKVNVKSFNVVAFLRMQSIPSWLKTLPMRIACCSAGRMWPAFRGSSKFPRGNNRLQPEI